MSTYRLRERNHESLLEDMLIARGIGAEEAEPFLNPDFDAHSHDPFLLTGMQEAVNRIVLALQHNEKVSVWSDYDCDGIPGGVMLSDFLRTVGLEVRHYIPDRHKEGYGLNREGLDELAAEGITLIVTIDLGTTEGTNIAYAKTKGIDVIVTDHHIVQKGMEFPNAVAVINPKRPDSAYPFDGLCGAGVAWKLVQGLLREQVNINRALTIAGRPPFDWAEGKEKWYLDLVGIATLSDMVPLVGENRMLAHFGLKVLRRARRPGLAALLQLLRIKPATLTEDDVGFMISPRINAASRMDNPAIAAQMLAAVDKEAGSELAKQLNKINDERKGLVASIVKEANKRFSESELTENPLIVMGSPSWRPGVLGLVASKLVESHGKTVFLWGREGGDVIRGSCRSSGTVNIVELMQGAADVFDHFGGHQGAGGFALSEDKVHTLASRLREVYQKTVRVELKDPEILVERAVDLYDAPIALKQLDKLSPFGVGNPKPLLLFPGVTIVSGKVFGKTANHLELSFQKGSARVVGIAFFTLGDNFTKKFEVGNKVDIVGHLEKDWRGSPRIRIVDIV
jgi:single-stranded-DNA-specific exonuclease